MNGDQGEQFKSSREVDETRTGRLLHLIGIRRREFPLAFCMAAYFFLAMGSVSVVKSLQNALYLGEVGFNWALPLLYVVLAVASAGVVQFYRKFSTRLSTLWLNILALALFIGVFLVFLVLLRGQAAWSYGLFYIWGGVFTIAVTTQGWLLSNQFYTTREAKRIFGLLGTGGIAGGAAGGFYTAWMAEGADALLVHVILALLAMQVTLLLARHFAQRREDQAEVAEEAAIQERPTSTAEVFRSRYLSSLAAMILVVAATTTVVDLQFKWALQERFPGGTGEIAQFFGVLLGCMYIFSAFFQLLGTSRLLRHLGVGAGLLALPIGLILGSIPGLIVVSFWAAVFLKLMDGTFRSSIHRTSVELLYIPLSGSQAVTAKSVIDLVVFRVGDALGATLFLGLIALFSTPLGVSGSVILGLAVLWGCLALLLAREYLATLRNTLESTASRLMPGRVRPREAGAERILVEALSSDSDAKVLYALQQLIASTEVQQLEPDFPDELDEVLVTPVVPLKSRRRGPPWLSNVASLLGHPSEEIAAAALHLLVRFRPGEYWASLELKCRGETLPDRLCLFYINRYADDPQDLLNPDLVAGWAETPNVEDLVLLARLMGKTRNQAFIPQLETWVRGGSRELANTALVALGRLGSVESLETPLEYLGIPWSRKAAHQALALLGPGISEPLMSALQRPDLSLEVKREIPGVLSGFDARVAEECLVRALYLPDSVLAFRALKGLNKIRDDQGLSYGEETFLPILQVWAREYYEILNLDLMIGHPQSRSGRLLKKAIHERTEWGIEKLFRGLELFLPTGDAYFSYLGYKSESRALRDSAIELIDLRIRGEIRHTILPIFAGETATEVAMAGTRLFDLPTELEQGLSNALFQADPWLKCCIIAAVRSLGSNTMKYRVERATEDVDPIVRETAIWALANWAGA